MIFMLLSIPLDEIKILYILMFVKTLFLLPNNQSWILKKKV